MTKKRPAQNRRKTPRPGAVKSKPPAVGAVKAKPPAVGAVKTKPPASGAVKAVKAVRAKPPATRTAKRRLTSRTGIAIMVLVAGVLLANAGNLTGIVDSNPVLTKSGLGTNYTQGALPGSNTIDPNDGYTAQALGRQAARDWIHGHVPYWNPYAGVGTPLAGEMQSAAMFPLVLLLLLSNGLLYMHVLLELVAGISTYLLLKRLGRSDVASAVGGLVFALNGTFAWLTNAIFNPIAFLPLLLLSIELMWSRSLAKQRMGWGLMAIALALSVYAGFPEVAFLDTLFAGGWAVVRLFQVPREDRVRFVGKLAAGALVGVALAAPILASFLHYLGQGTAGAHSSGFGSVHLDPIGVSSLFVPYIYGPIFGFNTFDSSNRLAAWWGSVGGFVTITVAALAVLALWNRKDRPLKLFLVLWSVIACLKIYGFAPVARVIALLPGIGATAFYRYIIVSVEMALIVLASYGIDDLLEKRIRRRKAVANVGAVVVVLIAILAGLGAREVRLLVQAPGHDAWAGLSIAWAFVSVLVLFGVAAVRSPQVRKVVVAGVVSLDAVGMFVLPQFSTPGVGAFDLGPVKYLQSHLGLQRVYGFGPLSPNYGSYFGIGTVDINDAILPKSLAAYIPAALDHNAGPFTFVGVNRVDPKGPSAEAEFISHLSAFAGLGVGYVVEYRNQIPPQTAAANGLVAVYEDPAIDVLKVPGAASYYEAEDGAQCTFGRQDLTHADLQCSGGGTLVRREQFMSGWRATVNGRRVVIGKADPLFQKVPLTPGRNRVVFTFSPPYAGIAWVLCGLAVVVMAILATDPLARRRRSARPSREESGSSHP